MGFGGLEGVGGGRNNMFHVCFMYVSVFWGFGRIFADFFVSITEVAEDAEDAEGRGVFSAFCVFCVFCDSDNERYTPIAPLGLIPCGVNGCYTPFAPLGLIPCLINVYYTPIAPLGLNPFPTA